MGKVHDEPGQRKRSSPQAVRGTRTALAPTRLANDASASSAIELRQVERRSAPTTRHPHSPRPYAKGILHPLDGENESALVRCLETLIQELHPEAKSEFFEIKRLFDLRNTEVLPTSQRVYFVCQKRHLP